MKGLKILALLFFISIAEVYTQEIPKLDSLVLGNGLKVYLLQYGESSLLNLKLVIDGGKKDETSCQVGYSEVIRRLLIQNLNDGQNSSFKKKNRTSCEIINGQTILSTNCLSKDFTKKMQQFSTCISKLSFSKHDKIHQAVSAIINDYTLENISIERISEAYRNLILFGIKNPVGRAYCQYQIQKMLPSELREFYMKQYRPEKSFLLICGNFKEKEVKTIITKQFSKWKVAHKEKKRKREVDLTPTKIKGREISFINKRDMFSFNLKWMLSAPAYQSSEYSPFLVACELFNQYLMENSKAHGVTSLDTFNFEPIHITSEFMEINCQSSPKGVTAAIYLMDTFLHKFSNLKFNENDLIKAEVDLKANFLKIINPEAILSFYNPLIYNFAARSNYLSNISGVTLSDLTWVIKKYFTSQSFKLMIIGNEDVFTKQLNSFENVKNYRTLDFESCDDACIVHSKKKWKKGHSSCCFRCRLRGWCPCMYSPSRLQ